MSGSEIAFQDNTLRLLRLLGHAHKHHNESEGVADISFQMPPHKYPSLRLKTSTFSGWIELKQLDRWPVRPDTIVRPDLAQAQRIWLGSVGANGGHVYVMTQIGREYWIMRWNVAIFQMDNCTQSVWRQVATQIKPYDAPNLARALWKLR